MFLNPASIHCFVIVFCIQEESLCKAMVKKERETGGDCDGTTDFALRSPRLVSAQAECNTALVVAGESNKYSSIYRYKY